MGAMPRVQSVVAPILREDPRLAGVTIVTWVPDIDFREFPMINIRRIGGIRNANAPKLHSLPVVEMSAYSTDGLIECEELYETALEVLYDAVKNGTQTPAGYLSSIFETMGATQFSSLYQDSWRIQGLIRLGVRTPRSTT
ncbi:tail terminator [Mycobacterium phage Lakes]|uniref:Gene 22 protein n=6 Tax=root TaxID=1 RepID=VG22_BPMD2|nr:tail terminator [Mycobacterium phage D29]O64216.1 RecName: Full=Gene 22 protein; AltName: Full=Gp22 [Fromanvirus D29]AOQ27857.1 tail terminator [Mycobacterium phage Pomar16]AXH48887.1 tail terminator [Mycobacterium phage Tomathan]QFG08789.1 tail terminator [Mycobacterium phage Naji]QJD52409.1 tail terminator [Mycobacterium phage D32]QUE25978.1 tail terminator [Mycobacterium phage Lakes]